MVKKASLRPAKKQATKSAQPGSQEPKAAPAVAAQPEKKPMGRPTKYRPEYCDQVIAMGKEGIGLAGYASEFGVDKASLYDWAERHPDFSIALSRAKTEEQAWWEQAGRDGMKIKGFNAVVWHKTMVAKFRDDYTEKITAEVFGKDGGPIKVETSTVDPRGMTPEQREALKVVMLALKENAR